MTERLAEILISSFPRLVLYCFKATIPLTVCIYALSLVLAFALALIQVQNVRILKQLARVYVWVFRGTPLIVQMYIIFFGLPSLGITLDAFPSAVIAFSLNYAAYMSETIRAAIQSVPEGQWEAGYMIGLSSGQIMMRVILPQAARVAFPTLFSSLIGLTKDSSLAASITVVEMFKTAQQIAARTFAVCALLRGSPCIPALKHRTYLTAGRAGKTPCVEYTKTNCTAWKGACLIMAIISEINPETAPASIQKIIADHLAEGHALTAEKRTLLHNAAAFNAVEAGSYALDDELQRLIGKRAADFFEYAISQTNGCLVCSIYFRNLLKKNGIDFDTFEFTEKEQILIDYGQAIAEDPKHVPQELFDKLKANFTEEEIVVITAMGVMMIANNYFNDILGVTPDKLV